MSDYVGATFLGSPSHATGRRAFKYVVIHTMVGTWQAANARFQNAAQQASATYGVCLDGSIKQWVREADTAYTNGTYYNNPGANVDSISIEHEDAGDYNGPRTPALYEASARLVADICKRHAIPIDRAHIIKHKECFQAATACPDSLNVDGIVARALVLAGSPPSGIGSGADPGNLPGSGDNMTPAEHAWLLRLYVRFFGTAETAADPALAAYQAQGEKERAEVDQILAEVKKPEPAEAEPASPPAISPQVATDLATIAGFLRKLGQ